MAPTVWGSSTYKPKVQLGIDSKGEIYIHYPYLLVLFRKIGNNQGWGTNPSQGAHTVTPTDIR